MTDSNYWVENYVSYSSVNDSSVHQASKQFEIVVSDSVDFNPSIEVSVSRDSKISIQVPKSTKYHKVKRIQEADFLQYFNQTLQTFQKMEISGGEYYIDTDDYADNYQLEAFFEKPHIQLSLRINHGIGLSDCSIYI